MSDVDFTPYSTGDFPDVTDRPLAEWLTIVSQGPGVNIRISAVEEYAARHDGADAPEAERISWREYFSWLADEPDSVLPWPELRAAVEQRLAELFGTSEPEPEPQSVAELCESVQHRPPATNTSPVAQKPIRQSSPSTTFLRTLRGAIPGEQLTKLDLDFTELYLN